MKKRLLSVLLSVLMIISLFPSMVFAEENKCTHIQKVTTITDGETYQMNLFGKNKGKFTFEANRNNWNIKNSDGKYLNANNGKLILGDTAKTAWTYKGGTFFATEKTTQKNSEYWWGWIYIPGWGYKTVTTTYYLNTVTNKAKLSTDYVCAELYREVTGKHDYSKAIYVDKTSHKYVCKYCGDIKIEAHEYNEETHKCVCGAYDPAESSVKISVDVNKKTIKQYIGWWIWGTWKDVTIYTANIKTEAKGVKVTKVEYQLNGERWTKGTCVSSDKPINTLKVKVWDSNGKLYEYEWPETPVPVYYNVTAQVQGDHGTATVKVGDEEVATASQALEGTNLVFEATPNDGYEFDYWEVVSGGIIIEDSKTNNPLNINMPDNALTIKAHLKATIPSTYNIIVEDDGHGTASANPTSAAPNATVTLTATPNEGYAFKEWQIIRGLNTVDITDNTFTMPSKEVKVKALFEKAIAIVEDNSSKGRTAYGSLEAAIDAASDGDTIYLVANEIECGRVKTGDKGLTFKPEGRNVTLTLNDSLLFGENDGNKEFTISGNDDYTLTIKPKLTDSKNSFRPIAIRQGNTLNMEDNVILTGSNFTGKGGGMLSVGSHATFNMNGGTFKGCKVTTSDYDNTNSQCGRGGAIFVVGNFNMYGGRIENCQASVAGGAIFVVGNFNMSGGKIVNCSVTGLADPGDDSKVKAKGGAVYLYSGSSFDMTGGEISGNTLSNVEDMRGAGVYAASGTNITLGGTANIKGNTNGDGKPSNLFLYNNQTINISNVTEPKNGMKIGVTTYNDPKAGYPIDITSNDNEDYVRYFVSDRTDYMVKFNTDHLELALEAYNIILENDGHGTVKAQVGGEDVSSAAPNATVALVPKANDGYAFKEWQIVRGLEAGAITDNSFTMPSKEVKVKAIFERVYNINIQTNEHGTAFATIGGKTATTAPANAEVTLTATPAEGYQLKKWKVVSGDLSIDDNGFTMPASNVTVMAVFEEISEIKTVANILDVNDFPDLIENAWESGTNKCYKSDDNLKFKNEESTFDLPLITAVSGNDKVFTCSYKSVTFTFNMTEGGVLSSIVFAGNDTLDGTYSQSACIAAGTMISMPEGKQKKVEELEIGDIICTFDHETGEVSSAPIAFIWESKNVGNAFTLTFENDVEVTVIEEHGFYDKEEQKYVFINLQNAEEYIGDHFYNADSNSWLELKNCEALNNSVDAYAIITSGHLNHMSNGMLSMCDGSVKVLANIFEYDEQMKFDEDKKKADIDTYGLTSKEKILELKGFTETDYDIYNLQYVDVMIGKGIITWEWMEALSDYCVANGL